MHLAYTVLSMKLRKFQGKFELPFNRSGWKKNVHNDIAKGMAKDAENITEQMSAINLNSIAYKGKEQDCSGRNQLV
jgi:hypothetical protein